MPEHRKAKMRKANKKFYKQYTPEKACTITQEFKPKNIVFNNLKRNA